ncbi:MAG TPA: hypothetical protein VES42_06015, partial [Pilimelia sp.]|nr:hypothetical protein [Pilimelia sp.]
MVTGIGVTGLLGWATGALSPAGSGGDRGVLAPEAAAGLTFAGMALLALAPGPAGRTRHWAAAALASLTAFIGVAGF